MIEKENIDNTNILKLSFRQDLLINDYDILSIYGSQSNEDSLKAGVQLMREFNFWGNTLLRHDPYSGMVGWDATMNPPLLNLVQVSFSFTSYDQAAADGLHMADISNSPLSVR